MWRLCIEICRSCHLIHTQMMCRSCPLIHTHTWWYGWYLSVLLHTWWYVQVLLHLYVCHHSALLHTCMYMASSYCMRISHTRWYLYLLIHLHAWSCDSRWNIMWWYWMEYHDDTRWSIVMWQACFMMTRWIRQVLLAAVHADVHADVDDVVCFFQQSSFVGRLASWPLWFSVY